MQATDKQSMLAVIFLIIPAVAVLCLIKFRKHRIEHPGKYPGRWAVIAHHIVVLLLILALFAATFLPDNILNALPNGESPMLRSGLIISAIIILILVTPLTMAADAAVTYLKNSFAKASILVGVWVLTFILAGMHFYAWVHP